ncbi:hypothetical protein ACIBEA_21480 [Streptomyces sp. NPDC051555]|uniref:hypothetical protein n=1 Tax=Streptomyces sp. NPDC051555 TaxID=3365657 RepID=UPI00378A2414
MAEHLDAQQHPERRREHVAGPSGVAQSQDRRILGRLAREKWGGRPQHIDPRIAGLMLALGPQPREGVLSEGARQQGVLLDTAVQWEDLGAFRVSARSYADELIREAARRDADKTLRERLPRWAHSRDTRALRALRKREVAQKTDSAGNLRAAVGRTHVLNDAELAYLKAKPVADVARAAVNTGEAVPDLGRFAPDAVTTAHRLLKAAPTAGGAVWHDPFHIKDALARARNVTAVTNSVEAWLAKVAADRARAAEGERQAASRAAEAERRAATLAFEAGLWGSDEEQLAGLLTGPGAGGEPLPGHMRALVTEHLAVMGAARAGGAVAYLDGMRAEEAAIERAKHTGLDKWLRQGCIYGKKGIRRLQAAEDLVTRRAEDIAVMRVLLTYGLIRPTTGRANTSVPAMLGLTTPQLAKVRGLLEPKVAMTRPGPGRDGLAGMIREIDTIPDARSMLKAVHDHGTGYLEARRRATADTLEGLRRGIEELQRSGKDRQGGEDGEGRKTIATGKALVAEAVSVLAALDRQIVLQHSPAYAALVRVTAPASPTPRHDLPA